MDVRRSVRGSCARSGGGDSPYVSRLMVEGSGLWRQPPGPEARVDMIVIAYTNPDSRTLSTTVAGVAVTVTATPVPYRFHWGDGTATTTTDPGAPPYPNHTVYHDRIPRHRVVVRN